MSAPYTISQPAAARIAELAQARAQAEQRLTDAIELVRLTLGAPAGAQVQVEQNGSMAFVVVTAEPEPPEPRG